MSIDRLQRPQLVVVGNGMAVRTVEELHWLGGIHDQANVNRYKAGHTGVPRKG